MNEKVSLFVKSVNTKTLGLLNFLIYFAIAQKRKESCEARVTWPNFLHKSWPLHLGSMEFFQIYETADFLQKRSAASQTHLLGVNIILFYKKNRTWIPWNLSFRYISFHGKRLQTMLWHHNARVNSHQRWKQTRFRVCFHLWCELTSTMNVTKWKVS